MRAGKLCKTLAWTACILGCMALTACADPAVSVGREKYPLDTTRLELSGDTLPDVQELARLEQLEVLDLRQMAVTAEEYEKLRAALPEVTAKYVEGATANATVEACPKAAHIYAEQGVLHIEPLIESPMEVWVVSANGRTVYHGALMEPLRLPVPSGLYFVVARQRGERQVEKLCVE